MGLRDRFFTPTTASAILSWRIAVGVGVAVATGVAGLPVAVAIGIGAAVYVGLVGAAMPTGPTRAAIDPFVLSEPWRRIVQDAQASGRKLREAVEGVDDGPLKQTLRDISAQLERGLDEAWEVARRGDEIDDAVRRLDRTSLRSKLATAEARRAEAPGPDTEAAVASLRRQLESADRLSAQSDETAASLRRTQIQLDELVARASEVSVGTVDTEAYRRDVDDLVVRLEALHQAIEETRTA